MKNILRKYLMVLVLLLGLAIALPLSYVNADSSTDLFTTESSITNGSEFTKTLTANTTYNLKIVIFNQSAGEIEYYFNVGDRVVVANTVKTWNSDSITLLDVSFTTAPVAETLTGYISQDTGSSLYQFADVQLYATGTVSRSDLFTMEENVADADWYQVSLLENSYYYLIVSFTTSSSIAQSQDGLGYNFAVATQGMGSSTSITNGYVTYDSLADSTLYQGSFSTETYTYLSLWFENDSYSDWQSVISEGAIDIEVYWLGNTATVDEVDPEFSYSNLSLETPYTNPITESEVRAMLSATDDTDGDVTNRIEVYQSQYPIASLVIGGDYYIMYRVSDTAGNYAYLRVDIEVIDDVAPVFYVDGVAMSSVTVTEYMSIMEDQWPTITAVDNVDGDVTASIVIPDLGDFVPGTYQFIYTVTDAAGNTASLTVTDIIIDDVAPVVTGPTKIVKGKTATLTLSDIMAQYGYTDNVGTDVLYIDGGETGDSIYRNDQVTFAVVNDGYTGNAQTTGAYNIRFSATDSAGNVTYFDVRVWVVDNVAPVWIVDDSFINLGINEVMTRTELIALLQASGIIPNDISYTVTFLSDEYTGNETIDGVYAVTLRVTYDDGTEQDIALQLNVEGDDTGDVIDVTPVETLTGFQKFINNLKSAVEWTWNLIKTIFGAIWIAIKWFYTNVIVPTWNWLFVPEEPVVATDSILSIGFLLQLTH